LDAKTTSDVLDMRKSDQELFRHPALAKTVHVEDNDGQTGDFGDGGGYPI